MILRVLIINFHLNLYIVDTGGIYNYKFPLDTIKHGCIKLELRIAFFFKFKINLSIHIIYTRDITRLYIV